MPDPLICFDLDGTLLDAQGRIHPNDIRLLSDPDLAARLIPCTGRPLDSVRRTLTRNGLYPNAKIPLALVLQNGSLLYAADELRLAYDPFEPAVQSELIDLAGRFKQVTFLFLGAEDIQVLWPNPFGMQEVARFEFMTRPFSEGSPTGSFSKVMCISPEPAVLRDLAHATRSWNVETALSMPTILEYTPPGIDKGSGLHKLLHRLGRDGQAFIAAGDADNDLPMFARARVSCAPDTAAQNVKARAAYVVHVAENGLLGPLLEIAARKAPRQLEASNRDPETPVKFEDSDPPKG